jgi:cell division protein FtsB
MVIRTRARAILVPIAFYLVLGVATAYLVWGASKGERGLEAKAAYEAQTLALRKELDGLKATRERWRRRVDGMRSQSVDRDLLDEEARAVLDRVGKDDVVIMTGADKSGSGGIGRP